MELARNKDDGDTQRTIVEQMTTRFPESPWLAEALYSSGNMYLLRKDYPNAIKYYGELTTRFPKSCESPHNGPCSNYSPSSHWRAAWLNYRLGQYAEAARLFDEQIADYPGGKEIPSALYWRGRLYETEDHQPTMAAGYYAPWLAFTATITMPRLHRSGWHSSVRFTPASFSMLEAMHPEPIPELSDDVPEDDPHVVKAKLLANAGLNEYIAPEIQAADGSDEWGAFAEAEIYASYGETWHAHAAAEACLAVLHVSAHRIDSDGLLAHSLSSGRTGPTSRKAPPATGSIRTWWLLSSARNRNSIPAQFPIRAPMA